MPQLASDDFERSDSDPIDGDWSTVPSTQDMRIVSNMMENAGTNTDSAARNTAVAWPDDQYSEVVIGATSDGDGGPAVRLSSSAKAGYFADGWSGQLHLLKWVAGVPTEIANFGGPIYSDGDTVRLEVIGDILRLFVNGVQQGADQSDSSIASGDPGCFAYNNGVKFESWVGGSVSGANVHVVTGRGNFAIEMPNWISIEIEDIPGNLTTGQAEPPNWYHVGMVSFGCEYGTMTAYPITREAELIHLPEGMTILYYEFAGGITATITERSFL